MRASQVEVPHLAFPLALAGKSFAVEEQDTPREIGDCVELICRTPRGRHPSPDMRDFGLADLTFRQVDGQGLPLADEERMLATYEPRVDTLLTDDPDEFDQAVRTVTVDPQGA